MVTHVRRYPPWYNSSIWEDYEHHGSAISLAHNNHRSYMVESIGQYTVKASVDL